MCALSAYWLADLLVYRAGAGLGEGKACFPDGGYANNGGTSVGEDLQLSPLMGGGGILRFEFAAGEL